MPRKGLQPHVRRLLLPALLGGAVVCVLGLRMLAGSGERGAGVHTGDQGAAGEVAGGALPGRGGAVDAESEGSPAFGGATGVTGSSPGAAGPAGDDRVSLAGGPEEVARMSWRGTLLEETTRLPIADARVTLAGNERSAESRSDAEGSFELAWWEGRGADLLVEHPDYVDLHVPDVALEEAGAFRLTPSCTLAGWIEPASEEEAVALAWHQSASSHRFWTELRAEVDANGAFVFPDLVPGEYGVTGEVAGRSVAVEFGLTLRPGERREVRLSALPGAVLHGRVLEAQTFEPIADAAIELELRGKRKLPGGLGALRSRTTSSAADGTYELAGLAPGLYRSMVLSPRGDRRRGEIEVVEAGVRQEHDFVLAGPARIRGRVFGSGGSAQAGARVVAFSIGSNERVAAVREGAFDAHTPETTTTADGSFLLENVPSGATLVVLAYPPDFDPGREGVAAPGSLVLQPLDPGQLMGGLVVEIPPLESIEGSVSSTEGDPLGGATITAMRFFGERFVLMGKVQSEGDGSFSIQPLMPGPYRVTARHDGHWEARTEVVVEGGIPGVAELALEPAYTVQGVARDDQGVGIPGLPIRLDLADGEELLLTADTDSRDTRFYASTDAAGRFRFEGIYAGTWTLFGSSYGWELVAVAPERLVVPSEEHAELTFLPRNRKDRFAITGVVALQGGAIPEGVKVSGLHGGFLEVDGGEFRATGLVPTRHSLLISAAGHAAKRVGPVDPIPGGTQDVGRVELLPATKLVVTVETKKGEPVEGAKVFLEPLPGERGGVGKSERRIQLFPAGKGRYRTLNATRFAWRLRVRHAAHETYARRIVIEERERQTAEVVLK